MSSPANDSLSSREQRLETVLAELLRAEESGAGIDREAILAQHPDLADDLRSFFRNRSAVDRFAEPLRSGDLPTIGIIAKEADDGRPRVHYFGDYEVLAEIARGGMGVVYKARQVSLNRTVALKMILAGQLASTDDIRRFRQEAEAAANLDHPHIVPIYEVGEHEGQYYFSMKLIEGGSLTQAIRSGRLQPRKRVSMMVAVARGVHHAHQRGLLHRDLKPGNILLDAENQPHVTDFGLARRLEGNSDLTQSGAIVGTPSYMAPEQAAANDELTTSADVYALGAILYELFTGRPPYCGSSAAETLVQLVTSEPPRPSALNHDIDRDLETICLKCLERDPRRRYDSAAALAEDLERWLQDEPVLARPATVANRVRKWTRRNPIVASLAAAVLAVAAVGLGGVVWQWREALRARAAALELARDEQAARRTADQERTKAEQARQQEASARDKAEQSRKQAEAAEQAERVQREQAEYEAYAARIFAAAAKLESGELQAAENLLKACPAGFRHWEWNRLKFLCHPELLAMAIRREPIAASYSPDGQRVVTTDIDYATQIWDAPSGHLLHTVHLGGDAGNFGKPSRFIGDGKRVLAALGHRKVGAIDVETGEVVWRYDDKDSTISGLDAANDGRRIAVGTSDGWLKVFSIDDGDTPAQQWKVNERGGQKTAGGIVMTPIFPVGFVQNDQQIVTIDQGKAKVWDVESHQLLHTFEKLLASGDVGGYVRLTADGRYLATAQGDHSLSVWNLETGQIAQNLTGHQDRIRAIAISADDRLIASVSADGTARIWELASGNAVATLRGHAGEINDLAFSPDGLRLVTAGRDRTARFWDTATGQPLLVVRGHSGAIRTARFSRDGRNVLTASRDKTVMVCDTLSDRGAVIFAATGGETRLAELSPDNRRVLTGSADGNARLWDATSGKLLHVWTVPYNVTAVAFGDGSRHAIASGLDGSIQIFEVESGNEVRTIKGTGAMPTGVVLSSHGMRGLVFNRTALARIYNLEDGTPISDLKLNDSLPPGVDLGSIQFAAFTPDTRYIVGVVFQSVPAANTAAVERPKNYPLHVVWECQSGKPVAHFRAKKGPLISDHVDFLPDGEHMVCCDHAVRKIVTAEIVRQPPVGDLRSSFAVSADGKSMLLGGPPGMAGLWDATTNTRTMLLHGLSEPCRAATFSPDGRRAITTTLDGPTRLWDTATGRELLTLPGDSGRYAQVAFSTDGQQLLIVFDGTAHLFPSAKPAAER